MPIKLVCLVVASTTAEQEVLGAIHRWTKCYWAFPISYCSVTEKTQSLSLNLCPVHGHRIAFYYVGLENNWRNTGVLQGKPLPSGIIGVMLYSVLS